MARKTLLRSVLLLTLALTFADTDPEQRKIRIRFYGESQCPGCRAFVTQAWPSIWDDPEFRVALDYDFIAWGNAYFATDECGKGPDYSSDERQCWYDKCMSSQGRDRGRLSTIRAVSDSGDDDCFSGPTVYQHSAKEGQVDIYESCVKDILGLDAAVSFTYCCEGGEMENRSLPDATALMKKCIKPSFEAKAVQKCLEERGHDIEVSNAKQTPPHPGVPYVTLDGVALDDPMKVKGAVCNRMKQRKIKQPKACQGEEIDAISNQNVLALESCL